MQINCIAIDDDPSALTIIEAYIKSTPFLNLVATCSDAYIAIEVLDNNKIDLIFTDIDMPGLNGMDFVKSLQKKPLVIFTTSHTEFAVEGFKVEATDYLVKPFDYGEFLNAASKAKNQFKEKQGAEQDKNAKDHIFIKSEYKVLKVKLDNIKYIQGMHEYVKIHLTDGKPIMTLLSLKKMEKELPGNKFMRIHRSYIVNLEHISTIERNRIIYGEERIPVGEQYKKKFQEFIDKEFIG